MARARPDGGLRQTFHEHLPGGHWQAVESGLTAAGIPDDNCCMDGVEFWIEYKRADHNAVPIKKWQVSWHERRHRAGGRTFLAVKRRDELHLYQGSAVRDVFLRGLSVTAYYQSGGGPAGWDWAQIGSILLGRPTFRILEPL